MYIYIYVILLYYVVYIEVALHVSTQDCSLSIEGSKRCSLLRALQDIPSQICSSSCRDGPAVS